MASPRVLVGPQWSSGKKLKTDLDSVGHATEDGERETAVDAWRELCDCVVTDNRAVSLNSELLNKVASIP